MLQNLTGKFNIKSYIFSGRWSKRQNGHQDQNTPLSDCNVLPFLEKGFKNQRQTNWHCKTCILI